MTTIRPDILLLQLEFPTWAAARPWTYSANFAVREGLSANGAAAWSYLKEAAEELSAEEVVTLFDRAAQILRARSQYLEMTTLTDPGEKQRKRAELRALFPAADEWYEYKKAASRGARPGNHPRGA